VLVSRLDKRGRKIGYNWWREWIMSQYHPVRDHWEVQFDLQANCTYRPGIIERHKRKARRGGHTEVTDFVSRNPPPTLRQFLEEHAGIHTREE